MLYGIWQEIRFPSCSMHIPICLALFLAFRHTPWPWMLACCEPILAQLRPHQWSPRGSSLSPSAWRKHLNFGIVHQYKQFNNAFLKEHTTPCLPAYLLLHAKLWSTSTRAYTHTQKCNTTSPSESNRISIDIKSFNHGNFQQGIWFEP